jgi:hypothetical protein
LLESQIRWCRKIRPGVNVKRLFWKLLRITGLETDLLQLPPAQYTGDAIHDFGAEGGGVVLRLKTDAGITVWGYSNFGMIGGAPRVVQTILEHEIKPVILGKDPAFPKRILADLWRALEYQGVQGMTQFAMSVVDIAVWDILGRPACRFTKCWALSATACLPTPCADGIAKTTRTIPIQAHDQRNSGVRVSRVQSKSGPPLARR